MSAETERGVNDEAPERRVSEGTPAPVIEPAEVQVPPKRSDDAERFNEIALRDGAVPAAAGASSMPSELPSDEH